MSKVRIEEVVKGRSCGADPLLEPALGSGHQEASRETFGCTHRPSTAVSDHAADHTVDLSSQVEEARCTPDSSRGAHASKLQEVGTTMGLFALAAVKQEASRISVKSISPCGKYAEASCCPGNPGIVISFSLIEATEADGGPAPFPLIAWLTTPVSPTVRSVRRSSLQSFQVVKVVAVLRKASGEINTNVASHIRRPFP